MSTIPLWARPDAEVVCVETVDPAALVHGEMPLVKGQRYTIRSVAETPNGISVHLKEFVNPLVFTAMGYIERGYFIHCFRPIIKRTAEQDIAEHFARHLTAPEGVNA